MELKLTKLAKGLDLILLLLFLLKLVNVSVESPVTTKSSKSNHRIKDCDHVFGCDTDNENSNRTYHRSRKKRTLLRLDIGELSYSKWTPWTACASTESTKTRFRFCIMDEQECERIRGKYEWLETIPCEESDFEDYFEDIARPVEKRDFVVYPRRNTDPFTPWSRWSRCPCSSAGTKRRSRLCRPGREVDCLHTRMTGRLGESQERVCIPYSGCNGATSLGDLGANIPQSATLNQQPTNANEQPVVQPQGHQSLQHPAGTVGIQQQPVAGVSQQLEPEAGQPAQSAVAQPPDSANAQHQNTAAEQPQEAAAPAQAASEAAPQEPDYEMPAEHRERGIRWGPFNDWGDCVLGERTCGQRGYRYRYRSCITADSGVPATGCVGSGTEFDDCGEPLQCTVAPPPTTTTLPPTTTVVMTTQSIPDYEIPPEHLARGVRWGPYRPWSTCMLGARSCGERGYQYRYKPCVNADTGERATGCVGDTFQTQDCGETLQC